MSDTPIPAEAIEAALRGFYGDPLGPAPEVANRAERMELAIRAADKARGLRVEHNEEPDIWVDRDGDVDVTPKHRQRLISDWYD